MSLASDGTLRDSFALSLVAPADRIAYERNARRFERAMGYTADCVNLSQFDPTLPSYKQGSYVPTGLTDANGQLLGTNLGNARDFLADARDALLVCCSFAYAAGAPEG